MLQIGSFSLNDFIQIFTDEEVSQLFVCLSNKLVK